MNQADSLLMWHKEQLGTTEDPRGSNRIRYNTIYYRQEVSGSKYPWCCAYQWCGFYECGLSDLFYDGKRTASCTTLMKWAQSKGRWVTSDYRKGDLFLYDWDGVRADSEHIGFYTGDCDSSGRYIAIEGNTNDMVAAIARRDSDIIGAFRPAYKDYDAGPTEETVYTVKKGDTISKIAAKYGTTVSILAAYNGIENPSLIYVGQKIKIPASDPEPAPSPDPVEPEPSAYLLCRPQLRELSIGMKGNDVASMQTLLLMHGFDVGVGWTDGDFGPDTDQALRSFQSANDLDADGVCGELSWAALINK